MLVPILDMHIVYTLIYSFSFKNIVVGRIFSRPVSFIYYIYRYRFIDIKKSIHPIRLIYIFYYVQKRIHILNVYTHRIYAYKTRPIYCSAEWAELLEKSNVMRRRIDTVLSAVFLMIFFSVLVGSKPDMGLIFRSPRK